MNTTAAHIQTPIRILNVHPDNGAAMNAPAALEQTEARAIKLLTDLAPADDSAAHCVDYSPDCYPFALSGQGQDLEAPTIYVAAESADSFERATGPHDDVSVKVRADALLVARGTNALCAARLLHRPIDDQSNPLIVLNGTEVNELARRNTIVALVRDQIPFALCPIATHIDHDEFEGWKAEGDPDLVVSVAFENLLLACGGPALRLNAGWGAIENYWVYLNQQARECFALVFGALRQFQQEREESNRPRPLVMGDDPKPMARAS